MYSCTLWYFFILDLEVGRVDMVSLERLVRLGYRSVATNMSRQATFMSYNIYFFIIIDIFLSFGMAFNSQAHVEVVVIGGTTCLVDNDIPPPPITRRKPMVVVNFSD